MPVPNGTLGEIKPALSGTKASETPDAVKFAESAAATALGGKMDGGSNSEAPLGS